MFFKSHNRLHPPPLIKRTPYHSHQRVQIIRIFMTNQFYLLCWISKVVSNYYAVPIVRIYSNASWWTLSTYFRKQDRRKSCGYKAERRHAGHPIWSLLFDIHKHVWSRKWVFTKFTIGGSYLYKFRKASYLVSVWDLRMSQKCGREALSFPE